MFRNFKRAIKSFKTQSAEKETITLSQLVDFLNLNGVSEKELSEATYFACLKILSESVGKLPLKLVATTEKNGVVEQKSHPYYSKLRYRPNRYTTSTDFFAAVEMNRNHYGNAYVWITNAKTQKDQQLILLPSDCVEVWYDDGKILSDIPDVYYIYRVGTHRYVFSSEEILHFKTSSSFDGIKGLSVREQLKSTIAGGQKSQTMVNKLIESGFTAKAVLQYTGNLSEESAKKFTANLEKYATGEVDALKSIIPIPLGSKLDPLNIKLGDNEFMEIKKYNALQIASAFGIKPNQINDYSKSSYANAEAQQLAFYVDTLLFILKQYEEELTYKLLTEDEIKRGLKFKFNVSVILRADLKTQIESLSKGVSNFIYTPNEARAFLDLEAKAGGDKLIGNGAMIPAELVGIQYQQKSADNGGGDSDEQG
mgnify:CR=1 FL=1